MCRALILLLVVLFKYVNGQPPQVHVLDSTFLKAIDTFIDSAGQLKVKFPVVYHVRISELRVEITDEKRLDSVHGTTIVKRKTPSYELIFSLDRDYPTFEFNPPSFVCVRRGKNIYISLNTEVLFQFDEGYKRRILSRIRSSLEKRTPGSSLVALMRIRVEGSKIIIGPFFRAY